MISGWKEEIQRDYLNLLRGRPHVTPAELAAHLSLSESWVIYWLTDLAREGKIRITGVELIEEDGPGSPNVAGRNTHSLM
jgi:DNA-binding Lrp family transcriptional regulator